jgi:hypothetical protein
MQDGREKPTDAGFLGSERALVLLGLVLRRHAVLSAEGGRSLSRRLGRLPYREE